ncbi:hypothetical protein [Sphingosinicella sp. BN140058]|uniref:hypothetical protein n=1 Tax=Sphingosinicella sp. BN140058 TaxID=1892855 RepID=UPI001012DF73|nr:hypothetical protein [Sphingosinicella sp. BN140058]QAY77577.1 hypothetical protein ETR14_14460 [Sphingosinicella sp. BN140058]
MALDALRELKQALLDTYGGFADGRIKKIDVGDRFIVDKRTLNDIAADSNVYGWFCSMFLEVKQSEEVILTMLNIPESAAVRAWLDRYGEPFARYGFKTRVARGEQGRLIELAELIEAITAPGNRYDVKHYKYSVPRVVDALHTLQAALTKGWSA